MSLNWKQRTAQAGQVTDLVPWIQTAEVGHTNYFIYDNGDGTYLSTVITRVGAIDWNDVVKQVSKSLSDAQAACQADWDSGNREKPRPEFEIGSAVIRPGFDSSMIPPLIPPPPYTTPPLQAPHLPKASD